MAFDTNYGECESCGAKLVENPKTGKIFCSKKCWLKKPVAPQKPKDTQSTAPSVLRALKSISDHLKLIDERLEFLEGYNKDVRKIVDEPVKDSNYFPQQPDVPSQEIDVDKIPF